MAESEAELTEIPAKEILDEIKSGKPVIHDRVKVIGELDVNELDLPTKHIDRIGDLREILRIDIDLREILRISEKCKVISSSIKITNSVFNDMVKFVNIVFEDSVDFANTSFVGNTFFRGATFNRIAYFGEDTFNGHTDFIEANFSEDYTNFCNATFNSSADFIGAKFRDADFSGATFRGGTGFSGVTFSEAAWFTGTTFGGNTYFDRAAFMSTIFFDGSKIPGDNLTFRDAKFHSPGSQEEACRRAKIVLERAGDREEAGYHFYHEMEGKRKQKPWYIRYPEFIFIQLVFGYGVHPFWLIYWWILIAVIFSLIYSIGNGISRIEQWYDPIKASFAIAIAPGYIVAISNPGSTGYELLPRYQAVAWIETLVGTFLWAGFIATFAKKYMK